MNLFVVLLKYKSTLDQIDLKRTEHIEFLDKFYALDVFVLSGPKSPRTGGVIIARAQNLEELQGILKQDPFYTNDLAEYEIHEFTPTKQNKNFCF